MEKHRGNFTRLALPAGVLFTFLFRPLLFAAPGVRADATPAGVDPNLFAAATAGDADSQLRLAFLYSRGNGVPQSYSDAAKWLRKAAGQGNIRAESVLGLYYERGLGVPQSDAQAVHWFSQAAVHGDAASEYALGQHYEHGEGVAKDYAQAADWYGRAAEQGNSKAEFNLALLYENGKGLPRDDAVAAGWLGQAASQGNAYAQTQLQWMEREQESRLELRRRLATTGIWISAILCLLFLLRRYRAIVVPAAKKLVPRTVRAKQLVTLLLAASWCSACCVCEFWQIGRPAEAAVKAFLLCAPAIVFGATCFWWLSGLGRKKALAHSTDTTAGSS